METRGNYAVVGAIAIALVVALFAFILWISGVSSRSTNAYDIFFNSGVSGLARGSQVQFSGVPVGTVTDIKLMPDTPEFVRVRIAVEKDVPILQGTLATLQSEGFTGVSIVQLTGAQRGAPPLTDPGPFGVPVIPTKPGGLGQLLVSAPQLLERLSTLSARLNQLLDTDNQRAIARTLSNIERLTGALASRSDEISATIVDARATLAAARSAATEIEGLARNTNALVDENGTLLVADLRRTIAQAERSLVAVERTAAAAEPGMQTLSTETLPEVNRLVLDLRQVAGSLGAVSAKLDEDPAGAILGGRTLPDYKPETK